MVDNMEKLVGFELDIMKAVRFELGKKYKNDTLMEWSADEKTVKKNLQEGERMLKVLGVYVAVKDLG